MDVIRYKNSFLIPSEKPDRYIFYSPLRGQLFSVSAEAAPALRDYLETGAPIPENYRLLQDRIDTVFAKEERSVRPSPMASRNRLVILLSQRCNLACEYCFAHDAHSNEIIDKDTLSTAIQYVFSNPESGRKRFVFLGGGEPTVTWELLTWAIDQIRELSNGQEYRISIMTNGTLLSESRILWLKERNVHVGLSFDVLPDVKDAQRPFPDKSRSSYDKVAEAIGILLANDMIPGIRSTITEACVSRMPEMVEHVHAHFPDVKNMTFEHVTRDGLEKTDYYDRFFESFFKARALAEQYGIKLENSTTTSVLFPRERTCSGELCITPTGTLVACHRASSARDSLYDRFLFGSVDGAVNIDPERIERLLAFSNEKRESCKTCFAFWSCVGVCPNNRASYSDAQFEALCRFNQKMIRHELETALEKSGAT